MDNSSVKNNIARIRKSKRLTQRETADRLGVSRQSYIDIEKGNTKLLADSIARLAKTFGITEEELLLGYEPQPSTSRLQEERAHYEASLESFQAQIRHYEELDRAQKQTIRLQEEIIAMQRRQIEALSARQSKENV